MSISPAPSSQSARATALPAPPAPTKQDAVQVRARISRRKLSAKPQQSVLWPTALPVREHDRVDRADRRGLGRERVEIAE